MIAILLLTHEDFGQAMLKSAELVQGKASSVKTLGLFRGDDMNVFCDKLKDEIESLDRNEGVLVLADLFGASPCNAAAIASLKINVPYKCVTGLNFPMLLEALMMRDKYNLGDLASHCMKTGKDGIKELFEELSAAD